jgi:hypothetical protein
MLVDLIQQFIGLVAHPVTRDPNDDPTQPAEPGVPSGIMRSLFGSFMELDSVELDSDSVAAVPEIHSSELISVVVQYGDLCLWTREFALDN